MLALGSNLRGPFASTRALLEAAVQRLPDLGLRAFARSRWWRSAAWPDPTDPDYLNGIVLVETTLPPAAVLDSMRGLERAFGREQAGVNTSRTLDLDLIAYGRLVLNLPSLILPHPRAAERLFVMGPLAELAPSWSHPLTQETAAALAARAVVGRDATPLLT